MPNDSRRQDDLLTIVSMLMTSTEAFVDSMDIEWEERELFYGDAEGFFRRHADEMMRHTEEWLEGVGRLARVEHLTPEDGMVVAAQELAPGSSPADWRAAWRETWPPEPVDEDEAQQALWAAVGSAAADVEDRPLCPVALEHDVPLSMLLQELVDAAEAAVDVSPAMLPNAPLREAYWRGNGACGPSLRALGRALGVSHTTVSAMLGIGTPRPTTRPVGHRRAGGPISKRYLYGRRETIDRESYERLAELLEVQVPA